MNYAWYHVSHKWTNYEEIWQPFRFRLSGRLWTSKSSSHFHLTKNSNTTFILNVKNIVHNTINLTKHCYESEYCYAWLIWKQLCWREDTNRKQSEARPPHACSSWYFVQIRKLSVFAAVMGDHHWWVRMTLLEAPISWKEGHFDLKPLRMKWYRKLDP